MAAKLLPDLAYLVACFEYDPSTGVLRWRVRPQEHFPSPGARATWNKRYSGKVVGYKNLGGYLVVNFCGSPCYVHRVIWKLTTGRDPSAEIDHKSRDRSDNRIANLREATPQENMRNSTVTRSNSSGFKGVSLRRRDNRFYASICVDRRTIKLGSFSTAEAAHAAYVEAAKKHFGDFWTHGDRHDG